MSLPKTLIKILEHPLLAAFAKAIKKFRHSKSYWSVVSLVIIFTIREAIAVSYGEAIQSFMTAQAEGSDYAWFWNMLGFIFDVGGSWILVGLGTTFFIILSLVKFFEKDTSDNDNQHKNTHEKLDDIKALIKLQGADESTFLIKYFGKDYSFILENPQTYHNFSTLLTQSDKTADELLEERENLLKKIASQRFSEKLQQQIDKAFSELRYDDARILMDAFLEANSDTEQAIIKAHYIKALSYMEQIRYHDAKEEFEHIGPSIDDTQILSDYASMYYTLGEYDKAITFYKKSLRIKLFTLGENHPDTATNYNDIGVILYSKGEYNKAITFHEKALKIILSTLGENHSSTATSYHNIGLIWYRKGEYDKAIALYEKSLKIILITLEENHPHTATTYNNIGTAWNSKGEYNKAITFYEKSLKIILATLGENHPETAARYNNIGSAWKSKGEYDKAISFYEKSLKIQIATLGENHPNTATSYNNIGTAWDSKGEYDKAMSFYKKSLKIRLIALGKNHPDTATSYNNIGGAWYRKGKYNEAITFFEKSLTILREIFPTGHPYIDVAEGSLQSAKEKLQKENK